MLYIWTDDYDGTAISQDGSQTSPIVFRAAPTGGTQEIQLWLRHTELSGDLAEASYDVTVTPSDDFGTDESTWIQLAPDSSGSPGTYGAAGAALNVGDINAGQLYSFWAKATVPSGSPGVKSDIYLKVEASQTPSDKRILFADGTFTHCTYDADEDAIIFDNTNTDGLWYSAWYDISAITDVVGVDYSVDGTLVYIDYRTSSDKTDTTATAWFGDVHDLDLTKDYFQVRVRFQRNGLVGTVGLIQHVYGTTNFTVFKGEYVGAQMPYTSDPGQGIGINKSVRWSGYFYAGVSGNYTWRVVSNDGHRMFIDGNTHMDNLIATSGDTTTTSSATTYLTAGYHSIIFEYVHYSGINDIKTYVTVPSTSERAIQLTDFIPYDPTLQVNHITLKYLGAKTSHYDMKFYTGPDVPVLISPVDGYQTKFFRPELTAHQYNAQYVEFQLDNDTTFGTTYLTDFIVTADAFDTNVSGKAPDGQRPPGVWYWRARSIYNGIFSNWSDWNFLTILPLAPYNEYIYINANIGLEIHDPIDDVRDIYLNDNVGLAPHDPTIDVRDIYINADVELGIGKVIYPFYDDTRPRKLEFDGDEEFIN